MMCELNLSDRRVEQLTLERIIVFVDDGSIDLIGYKGPLGFKTNMRIGDSYAAVLAPEEENGYPVYAIAIKNNNTWKYWRLFD